MAAAFKRAENSQAVSLGASIGTAISFDAMCLDGAPFYYPNQDIFEIEALADRFLSQPTPPRYFFVTLLPTALQQDNGLRVAGTSRRRSTYRFLHAQGYWKLIGSDWREAIMSEAMPAIGHDLRLPWQNAARKVLWPELASGRTDAREFGSFDRTSAILEAKQYMSQRQADLDRFSYVDPYVPERTKVALQRTLRSIRSQGATMIVVVTPVTSLLRAEIARQDLDETAEFDVLLEQLENDGAVVANYFEGSSQVSEFGHFRDNHHLNAKGAAAFSRQLGRELRARAVIPPPDCEVRLPAGK